MRARLVLSVVLALAVPGISCGGGQPAAPTLVPIRQATRTFTPATPSGPPTATVTVGQAPASPTAVASVATADATTAAVVATVAPQPTTRPRTEAVTVTIRAANLSFDQSIVHIPAGARVTATLRNDDAGVQHNLSFSLPGLGHGETCTGPCTATQTFTAATAGSYFFLCTLHDMTGTLVVDP